MNIIKHKIQHEILGIESGGSIIQTSTGSLYPYQNYWAIQSFTGVVSTTITLTQNQNADIPLSPANIINSTAVVVKNTDGNPAYTGLFSIFSQRIEVLSHTSNSVTLNAIPYNGVCTLFWLQRGVPPLGAMVAPDFVREQRLEWLNETYIDKFGDQMAGTLDMNNNYIINLPLPITSTGAARLMDINIAGHVIQNNGTPVTQRSNLNIIGATVEDDLGNNATKITITSTGGSSESLAFTCDGFQNVENDIMGGSKPYGFSGTELTADLKTASAGADLIGNVEFSSDQVAWDVIAPISFTIAAGTKTVTVSAARTLPDRYFWRLNVTQIGSTAGSHGERLMITYK